MTPALKQQLINRLKSFAWRVASMAVVAGVAFILDNQAALHIPTWAVGSIGLISGEVTKFLNSKA